MKTLILTVVTAITLIISACGSNSTSDKNESTDSTSVHTAGTTYTCPMHPEVISDKPGTCPECKMDLVEKGKVDSGDHTGHQH